MSRRSGFSKAERAALEWRTSEKEKEKKREKREKRSARHRRLSPPTPTSSSLSSILSKKSDSDNFSKERDKKEKEQNRRMRKRMRRECRHISRSRSPRRHCKHSSSHSLSIDYRHRSNSRPRPRDGSRSRSRDGSRSRSRSRLRSGRDSRRDSSRRVWESLGPPADPHNPLHAAYDVKYYDPRMKSASHLGRRRNRRRNDPVWDHDKFCTRSESPDRTRTSGMMWDCRAGSWKAKAGGVYLPDTGANEFNEMRCAKYRKPLEIKPRTQSPIRSLSPKERDSPKYDLD